MDEWRWCTSPVRQIQMWFVYNAGPIPTPGKPKFFANLCSVFEMAFTVTVSYTHLTNSASSERSGPVTAGAAAGLTAGAGAAFGAGAAAFFFPSSHAWMYLKHEIRILTVSYTHLDVYKRQ